jgi:Tfp pilus assembly protein FimV
VGERADDFDRIVFRPVQGIGDNLMELNRVLTELRAQNEALRAALTQSAEKLAAAEAERAEGMEWLCRDTGCKPEAPLPVVAAYVHGLYCGATARVARLELTVERMTGALRQAAAEFHEQGWSGHAAVIDRLLAASSPDHAGAPAGEAGEGETP